ncbi:MAG: type II toxin-antitoxin system PemK/MazF family toxin [Candidatus Poribacteria bacterium]|nr:type II toxin-antitoxin system PemK/MazF family toxin [Candidatus Poribacteria bacterium]
MLTLSRYDQNYIPVRGDVVNINFNPQIGREIWDWRPALVLSSWDFNRTKNVAIICPITRTTRGSRFEIEIPEGLEVHGFIRTDQVKSLDWQARKAIFLCVMPNETVVAVVNTVQAIIWGI